MSKIAIFGNYIYYDNKIVRDSYLLIENEYIAGIEKNINKNDYDEVIIKKDSAIFPGFINTHTHLPMVYFRGLADDLPLMDWLQKHIWPAENKWLSDEFVYDATLLAACELIRCGTICANDMYFYSKSIADALIKAGVKGVIGAGVLDFPTKFAKNLNEYLNNAEKLIDRYNDNPLIRVAICPHAPYTVSPESYKECIKFAEKHNLLIHTHLAETEWEINEIKNKYGKSPIQLMNEVGMFDTKAIFAHMVHLNQNEIELIGKKSVNISHCLESNFKLASGFAPIKDMLENGVNVTIGTDGAASNNDLDILAETSTVAKFHKAFSKDATALNAETVLKMLTRNAAKALYLDKMGIIKKGYYADFIVIDLNKPHLQPIYNPISHLIYSTKSSDITDVFINGKHILKDGIITTIDEEEILEKAKYWSNKIKNEN
ncbi:N-ethylammeline chlorohydrolase [Deferribacter desulfuricans SSM1]|uniref:5-methylthioadenosine/S-adenosylhomocysteine deaminase n=1 Tax=Deferribacter desulfuricans (strain DSM 14783 / JCM 11476 / NBRC 101012 / SSM1) TaxID=639282 RepID=D3PDL8_DEFDS|nr:amidohydrolase family protein [Deferribacter desulfuricans]BAI80691.1 N-ethylammeline chlorohydrolase [Deferribacter desulfuricans SSM1]